MFLKNLSNDILDKLDMTQDDLHSAIKKYAKSTGSPKTKEFNLKRSFDKMSDSSFNTFLDGVLPIQEYKLTLEVKKDNKTYSTSISKTISPPTDYIRLANTTCLQVVTDKGVKLIDIKSEEYLKIIGAYDV